MTPNPGREEYVFRIFKLLLTTFVLCARPLAAQELQARADAEFRLSPLIGYAPGFRRVEQREMLFAGQARAGEFERRFASGTAGGAALEVRWIDPFRVTTAAVLVSRGRGLETALASGDETDRPGGRFLMARAGVAVRLHEPDAAEQIYPVNMAVFAAPAYVLEIPDREAITGKRQGPLGSPGVSFGAEGELPLGDKVGVQFAVEDWVAFWNRDELERRTSAELASAGLDVRSVVYPAASHMWLLRAGFSFRF
jgi:hypothetical protein